MNTARFFSYVHDAPWYFHFLYPVLQSLQSLKENSKILDVGTGTGKLLELGRSQTRLLWTGAETDSAMLDEARRRPALRNVPLYPTIPDKLPFDRASFDAVTFCSVLFLISNPFPLLDEAARILRPNGRLVALTPTGEGHITPQIMRQIGWHPQNWTAFLWRQMTAGGGRIWTEKGILPKFAQQMNAIYNKQIVFNGLAVVEWITKTP